MNKIYTHTLVKNGMPFIDLVLRQVEPFAEKMLITLSQKSTDGTAEALEIFAIEFPDKVELMTEDVAHWSDLTIERQKQLDMTPDGKWVLFLDDDDYWSTKNIQNIVNNYLNQDVDALSVRPFQVIDRGYYDTSWRDKWFTKWFKKQPGVHYKNPWPRDVLYLNDEMLYWRKNKRVPCIPEPYFHLSNIKDGSFRNEEWAKKYKEKIGVPYFIPELYKKDMEKIYGAVK